MTSAWPGNDRPSTDMNFGTMLICFIMTNWGPVEAALSDVPAGRRNTKKFGAIQPPMALTIPPPLTGRISPYLPEMGFVRLLSDLPRA